MKSISICFILFWVFFSFAFFFYRNSRLTCDGFFCGFQYQYVQTGGTFLLKSMTLGTERNNNKKVDCVCVQLFSVGVFKINCDCWSPERLQQLIIPPLLQRNVLPTVDRTLSALCFCLRLLFTLNQLCFFLRLCFSNLPQQLQSNCPWLRKFTSSRSVGAACEATSASRVAAGQLPELSIQSGSTGSISGPITAFFNDCYRLCRACQIHFVVTHCAPGAAAVRNA